MIQYNNENSLSSVLSIAYLSAMQYYFKPIREFPAGRGFADFVFIPKPEFQKFYPALVVELKWNKDVKTALDQIKDRKYPDSVACYAGELLLVGINYNEKTKETDNANVTLLQGNGIRETESLGHDVEDLDFKNNRNKVK